MRNLLISIAILLLSAPAAAQSARARVSRGAVDGVEMSLEGGLVAPRGGALRWLITAYEVLGLSDLRPANDAVVHVSTSIARTEDAAEVHTDPFGRAQIELTVPDDAPDSFQAVIRIVSHEGIQRRYELTVRVRQREQLAVYVARSTVSPDGPLRAFGRLSDGDTGRGLAAQTLRLTFRDQQGRPLDAAAEVRTDEAGLFAHTFELPRDVRGQVIVEARTQDDEHPVFGRAVSNVAEPQHPPLLVALAPEHWLVRPGVRQYLDVVVRTPEGRPLEGTVVTLDSAPSRADGRQGRTDARGRARLSWEAANFPSGIQDVQLRVSANREGWGGGVGIASVRVAADAHAASLAVEGGALSPTIGGRVYVRVVNADGRPAGAGIEVHAIGPRLGATGLSGRTDDAGVATLDVVLVSAGANADRCGGETATAIDVNVGATQIATCLPLDPDAAARVRTGAPIVRAGGSLEVTVDRAPAAARLPVEVSVISASGPSAIASAIIQPSDRSATVTIPEDVGGLVWVRARPLVGAAREVVRGGVTGAWVVSGDPMTVSAELTPSGQMEIGFGGAATGTRSTYVVAAPIDDARQLADLLSASALGPLGDLRMPLGAASSALLSAAIAAATPADDAAPAVLRGSQAIPSPAPSNPEASGLLRDPWRSRARFVTGRLALIFRALEGYIGQAVPERIDDVAVRGARGGASFNAQILESIAASGQLGAAGATGLGGDPLTIEQLQRFDPTLTYDNVARRITRERLFRLILALRHFVSGHAFDLPWSRLGDPSEWMRQLVNQYVPAVGQISQRDMVDAWGHPFELRPTRGGRSRFSFVDPLGSWEVVSAGVDGRFGSGDDVWDPTARVLRSGTPYADAVGEDVLVARLEGVELGRASIELLQSAEPRAAVGGVPHRSDEPARARAQQLWAALPSVLQPPEDPLGLRRPAHPGDGAGGTLSRVEAAGGQVRVALDEEPRTWGAVVYAWTDAGYGAVALASTLAGAPLIVEADLPERLRAGEDVEVDAVVTNVSEEAIAMTLTTSGTGVAVDAPDELTIGAGEAHAITLRLSPEPSAGRGEARVDFVAGGETIRRVRWDVRRVSGDHPLRLRAAGLARRRPWSVHFETPADARRIAGRVVVLAPSALAGDPDLEDVRERDPALIAFSDALAGRSSDPALWAGLLRRQNNGLVDGQDPMISTACAAVAWATADEHDADARAALDRLRAAFAGLGDPTGSDPAPDAIRTAAATLGALAAGGVPELTDAEQRALDPLTRLAAAIRIAMRRTIRNYPEVPTLLARAAAALLLADPRDAYGLAMLERAQTHLQDAPDGGALVVAPENPDELDSLAATAALAVAAHQAGRAELAERLLRGALGREHVALRAGGETAFWLLASGAYGVLGTDATNVTVIIDGRSERVALESGRAVIAFAPRAGSHSVRVESVEGAAFVRVEAVMERPFVTRAEGPFALTIEGDVGDTSTGAGLELSVRATRAVGPSILDLQLPAGVEGDDALRASIHGASGVTRVEEREPGFLRIWLAPMGAGVELAIPLLLRWTARGDLLSLGVVGYELASPGAMSSIAPRQLPVQAGATP